MINNTLGSRIAGGNTEYERIKSDYYPTPPEATIALIKFLQLSKGTKIWEPACGEGYMSEVFGKYGYEVISTDINDTGYGTSGVDYLNADLTECDWIITNPPFKISAEFIKRSISHKKPFAMLLKSHYWHTKSRLKLFQDNPPKFVLPLTWRPDFLFKTRGKGSPLMDVIWCVWDGDCSSNTLYIPLSKPQ